MKKFFRMPKKELAIFAFLFILLSAVLVYAAGFEFTNITGGVGRSERVAYTIAATGTTFDETMWGHGTLKHYVAYIPKYTNSTETTTLSILDGNGYTVYTGSAHDTSAAAASFTAAPALTISGSYKVRLTLSGAAGGTGGTAYVYFVLEQ